RMMGRVLLALAALFLMASCSAEGQYFCSGWDRPCYRLMDENPVGFMQSFPIMLSVLNTILKLCVCVCVCVCVWLQDFEVRLYDSTKWLSTRIKDKPVPDANAAFGRLTEFCKSHAEAGISVFTWPALVEKTGQGEYFMHWFIPKTVSLEADPADPADPYSVTVVTRPEATVFVGLFGGIPSLESGESNYQKLCENLNQANTSFSHQGYIGAAYEPLFSVVHHNEIWIFAD
uniref:Heme-binding protein soul5, like n=1 Tax=Salarias fasciatus TaxID=181472 RepID=A0A672HAE6_SALFA